MLIAIGMALMTTIGLAEPPRKATALPRDDKALTSGKNEGSGPVFDKSFESFAPAVERVAPAVVRIVTAMSADNPSDLSSGVQDPAQRSRLGRVLRGRSERPLEGGLGSGVIVTEDGYILTNGHLIIGANEVQVTLPDGRDFKARVIGLDPRSDIAVVKVPAQHLPTVPLAESRKVRVGDLVLAVGHPFGVGQTVTHGIVSATDRGGIGIEDYETFIQTDAPINPGNSGGALVDVTGHLIGINTAIISSSGGNLGIGFAVPSDLALRVMSDLIKHGEVARGYLGVETQDLTPELAEEFKAGTSAGVLVGGLAHDGPAERAGLQVGDVITRFGEKDVHDSRQLKLSVAETKPGDSFDLELLRGGVAQSVRVTVGQVSNIELVRKESLDDYEKDSGALQGVILGELNGELRQQLRIPGDVKGAVVLDLHAYSTAAQAGLRPGDVIESINRQDVANAAEALRFSQQLRSRHTLFRVWSRAGSRFVLVGG